MKLVSLQCKAQESPSGHHNYGMTHLHSQSDDKIVMIYLYEVLHSCMNVMNINLFYQSLFQYENISTLISSFSDVLLLIIFFVQQQTQMWNNPQDKIPVLLSLLENNNIEQIVKVLINRNASHLLIEEYDNSVSLQKDHQSNGKNKNKLKKEEKDNVIIAINRVKDSKYKKSTFSNPKFYQDIQLKETLRRKLRLRDASRQERQGFWLEFTEIYQKPNFYQNLKEFNLATDFQSIIEKDIMRTNCTIQVRTNTQEVLKMFAVYNPYLGYCQGMNFLVAFIIEQGFTNEQAFFILKRMTEQILPLNYYVNMDCVVSYLKIFFQIMHITHSQCLIHLKQIMDQLDQQHLTALNFIFQYFINIFCTERIPENLILFIWDFFLLQGVPVLFKAGLGLFDILHDGIIACKNYQQFDHLIKNYEFSSTEVDKIKKKIREMYIDEKILMLLSDKLIDEKRQEKKLQKEAYLQKHKDNPYFGKGPKKLQQKCDPRWNFCLQMRENNSYHNFVYENFVFKSQQNVVVKHNYIQQNRREQQIMESKHIQDISVDLLIGRIPHVCEPSYELMTDDSHELEQKKSHLQQLSFKQESLRCLNPEQEDTEMLIFKKISELINHSLRNQQIPALKSNQPSNHNSQNPQYLQDQLKKQDIDPNYIPEERQIDDNRVSTIDDLLNDYSMDEMFQ